MKAKAKETSARIGLAALAGAGMTVAFPALAFAAEEESSGGLSAILPDMAEFIPMLVIFILLWIVLAKFGWPKFEAMLEKREMTIKDSLEKSEQARVESERVLEEYKRQLEDAKAQAAQIVTTPSKRRRRPPSPSCRARLPTCPSPLRLACSARISTMPSTARSSSAT